MPLQLTTRQRRAYSIGAAVLIVVCLVAWWPANRSLAVPGPHNVGHDQLACGECHAPAPGTMRQQLQASVRHWLGQRRTPARFMTLPAGNEQCLDCHRNENDVHPVYRFNEPRFEAVRAAVAPQHCTSCHRQHQGERVTAGIDVCRHCHQEMALRSDPVDVSHAQLAAEERWETCLACHDFHGNHAYPSPERLADRLSDQQVLDYLQGGPSPYGNRLLTVMQTMRKDP